MSPSGTPPSIAPSLARKKRGVGTSLSYSNGALSEVNGVKPPFPQEIVVELGNPTVIPHDILKQFHFTFLIRHPRKSIPSFFRCTVPPLDKMTGFYEFMPSEAGYSELRRIFGYLCSTGQVGPVVATHEEDSITAKSSGHTRDIISGLSNAVDICVIDADDLLDNPAGIIQAYCDNVGLDYDPSMLKWDSDEDHEQACRAFEKWKGFHEDAIASNDLKPRVQVRQMPHSTFCCRFRVDRCFEQKTKSKSREEDDTEWMEKFGAKGAKVIREAVDSNVEDYEYLKRFALKV